MREALGIVALLLSLFAFPIPIYGLAISCAAIFLALGGVLLGERTFSMAAALIGLVDMLMFSPAVVTGLAHPDPQQARIFQLILGWHAMPLIVAAVVQLRRMMAGADRSNTGSPNTGLALLPPAAIASPAPLAVDDPIAETWRIIQAAPTVELLEEFILTFPNDPRIMLARMQLRALKDRDVIGAACTADGIAIANTQETSQPDEMMVEVQAERGREEERRAAMRNMGTLLIASMVFLGIGAMVYFAPEDRPPAINDQAIRTLVGHKGWVNAVSIAPDGETAISSGDDKTIRIWKLTNGRALHALLGHSRAVGFTATTPDGKIVISAGWDNTVKVWELDTGRELHTLKGHSKPVLAVAISPDGKTAVSGGFDDKIKTWDIASGREMLTLVGHSHTIKALAFTPHGKTLVSGSEDKSIKVWDVTTGKVLSTFQGRGAIRAIGISPDGTNVVAASENVLQVWNLASGHELPSLVGHLRSVNAVAISMDGKTIVSGGNDASLRVWDSISSRELLTLSGHSSSITSVAITPDNQTAVSASQDGTLKVWRITRR